MKWPASISLIRHGASTYNGLRAKKEADPEYVEFMTLFREGCRSPATLELAERMRAKYALGTSDYDTPLSSEGCDQARRLGSRLSRKKILPDPDVVFVSPYFRTRETLRLIGVGGVNFKDARVVIDDRIREQEHGLSLLYSDWRLFHVFHPEQEELHGLMGPYWYQYPQGENVSMVRDRIRSFTNMLVREMAGKHVWLVTHHLTILSVRANYERLSPEEFIHLDNVEKPINCGATLYRGDPKKGMDGKLELEFYNQRHY